MKAAIIAASLALAACAEGGLYASPGAMIANPKCLLICVNRPPAAPDDGVTSAPPPPPVTSTPLPAPRRR